MQRVFLEDCGPRYPAGTIRDWPMHTWRNFKRWDEITQPVELMAQEHVAPAPVVEQHAVADQSPAPEDAPRRRGRPPKHLRI